MKSDAVGPPLCRLCNAAFLRDTQAAAGFWASSITWLILGPPSFLQEGTPSESSGRNRPG